MSRLEGRLFAKSGSLFMVVATNTSAGTAEVSCCLDGQRLVIDMTLAEVSRHISASAGFVLDNLNGPEAGRRIEKRNDGWHFSAREGFMGPYASEMEAARELGKYVLAVQTVSPARRDSGSPGTPDKRIPRRRNSDTPASAQAV